MLHEEECRRASQCNAFCLYDGGGGGGAQPFNAF